jgi:hypothetical protein
MSSGMDSARAVLPSRMMALLEVCNKNNLPLIGDLRSALDFNPDRVKLLRERGYQDAKRCLEPILKTLAIEQSRRKSLDRLQETTQRLIDDPPVY